MTKNYPQHVYTSGLLRGKCIWARQCRKGNSKGLSSLYSVQCAVMWHTQRFEQVAIIDMFPSHRIQCLSYIFDWKGLNFCSMCIKTFAHTYVIYWYV